MRPPAPSWWKTLPSARWRSSAIWLTSPTLTCKITGARAVPTDTLRWKELSFRTKYFTNQVPRIFLDMTVQPRCSFSTWMWWSSPRYHSSTWYDGRAPDILLLPGCGGPAPNVLAASHQGWESVGNPLGSSSPNNRIHQPEVAEGWNPLWLLWNET